MGSLQSKVTMAEKNHFGHIGRELGCSIEINLVHKNLIQAVRISEYPVSCISNLS